MSSSASVPEGSHILGTVPRHLGIIMDGNGRWARERGLPRVAGHRAGTENLRRILNAVVEFGVPVLTIYAFSTENWSRPQQEVSALLRIMERAVDSELGELHRNGVRIRHIGDKAGLGARLAAKVAQAEEMTRDNTRLTLNIAWNYGGRAEVTEAVRQIVREGIPAAEINEETISQRLYTAGLEDPDLIIRTGGDMRLSNFMIWQASYAELYSTQVFWPDFDREQLYHALLAFQSRQRRFGGLTPELSTD